MLFRSRIETVKARLLKNLEELAQKPDPARFEQELIFYLEKFDINEEKVRLRQHCRYFMETIDGEPYPGKKLGSSSRRWAARSTPPVPRRTTPASSGWSSG